MQCSIFLNKFISCKIFLSGLIFPMIVKEKSTVISLVFFFRYMIIYDLYIRPCLILFVSTFYFYFNIFIFQQATHSSHNQFFLNFSIGFCLFYHSFFFFFQWKLSDKLYRGFCQILRCPLELAMIGLRGWWKLHTTPTSTLMRLFHAQQK